jgi:hypothetical protein
MTATMDSRRRHQGVLDEAPPHAGLKSFNPAVVPFAGRIGGNQALVLDPDDPANEKLLRKLPDAAPYLSLQDSLNLAGFADIQLWKYATVECIGE